MLACRACEQRLTDFGLVNVSSKKRLYDDEPQRESKQELALKICILLSDYENTHSFFKNIDPGANPTPWLKSHELKTVIIAKTTAEEQIKTLACEGFDVFLNLCDGITGDDLAGVEACQALEKFQLPFTGPGPHLYELTKEEMKQAAQRAGVDTPDYVFAYHEDDIERAAATLKFPLIVKHFNGYASIGMTRMSRVQTVEELREQARLTISRFGGALIETFIEGGEASVLVVEEPDDSCGPRVLTPVICHLPPGESFKHFDLKWHTFEDMSWRPSTDTALNQRLTDAARRIFLAIGGVSYSRCDFRIDEAGRVWFLEINTICGIFYPPGQEGTADMILTYDPIGFQGFLELILKSAVHRQKKAIRTFAKP